MYKSRFFSIRHKNAIEIVVARPRALKKNLKPVAVEKYVVLIGNEGEGGKGARGNKI